MVHAFLCLVHFSDYFALQQSVLGKSCNFNAGASGEGLGEVLAVDTVNGGEIVEILDENGGLEDLVHAGAGILQQSGQVLENLMCLSFYTLS